MGVVRGLPLRHSVCGESQNRDRKCKQSHRGNQRSAPASRFYGDSKTSPARKQIRLLGASEGTLSKQKHRPAPPGAPAAPPRCHGNGLPL